MPTFARVSRRSGHNTDEGEPFLASTTLWFVHAAEKWQRNPILNAIVEGGLDPIECSFD